MNVGISLAPWAQQSFDLGYCHSSSSPMKMWSKHSKVDEVGRLLSNEIALIAGQILRSVVQVAWEASQKVILAVHQAGKTSLRTFSA
jgi:hypothetical protein